MLTVSEAIALAAVSVIFTGGGFYVWVRLNIREALRLGRSAHVRINQLETATGRYTTLRSDDEAPPPAPPSRRRKR